jgi:predicted MPP superfamily phosphohydrolase
MRGEVSWFGKSQHQLQVKNLKRRIKILHLTDVHIRSPCEWLDQLCDVLKRESPDLIAITGDVVTKGWTPDAVSQFFQALPECPLGRVAVLGNWEHWSGADPDTWGSLCSAHGVQLLNNHWIQREGLVIAGTDDWLSGDPDIDRALAKVPESMPVLVLTHSPGLFPVLAQREVDLVLSGHSHGGQVRLPILGALWVPKGTDDLVAGWYEDRGSHLFVSRGIGWSIAPLRLWCPPEMALIELIPG